MAARYWVGGNASWDATTGTKWSLTSGGVGGQAVPTNADDVFLDNGTGTGNVTIAATSVCKSLNCTGYVGTLAGSSQLTVSGNVTLVAGMTNNYTGTLIINAASTINSGGKDIYILATIAGVTYTLASNIKITNTWNCNTSTLVTITGAFNVEVNGVWNCNQTSGSVTFSGSSTVSMTGNSSYIGNTSVSTISLIGLNLTINSTTTTFTNVFRIGSNSTITYTAGTMTMTGSTLIISGTGCVLATSGMTWNNVNPTVGGTTTLSSNLNVSGTFTNSATTIFNGNTINITGSLTMNSGISGTSIIKLTGTGTWSHAATTAISNNLTIDTTGTLTISGNVYYNTGTLTYIANTGTVITTGSVLNIIQTSTLDTSGMTWNNVTITSGTQTLTSDFNCQNLTSGGSGSNTINGLFNVNISGNITATGIILGTSTIVLIGTGLWTALNSSNTFRIPIIINTNGIISLPNSLYHESGLTYIKGTVKSNNTTITFGGGTVTTLVNLHKLIFKNVIIGAGNTITMNEFFSGSPSLVTNVSSTSTTNYTIAFQDGFEKIAKFVDISGCKLSKPLQLLVTTNSKRKSTNIGIRYINQSPNGIAKGEPSVNLTTFGAGGLLADPINL